MKVVLMWFAITANTGIPVSPTDSLPSVDMENCRMDIDTIMGINQFRLSKGDTVVLVPSCEIVPNHPHKRYAK